ncbi:MAG: 2-oxoglutarate dehydrogenase complex dihydrolipoyllysine-residue succinyltransferase [Gammaproteobacteria bacterium]
MSIEVKVPPLPESVADATLVTWHHKAGDSVRRDDNLVDLETDKVVLEVPAPSDGVLREIKIADGTTVTAGEVLAVLEPGEVAEAQPAAEKPAQEKATKENAAPAAEADSAPAAAPEPEVGQRMGPAVRALVEEHALNPSSISGTGRDGRITKSDVLSHIESGSAGDSRPMHAPQPGGYGRSEQRVPMTRLRARVAERLVEVQRNAALLTTFNEVDMSAIIALRRQYQEEFVKRHEIKLGFMSFFVRASIEALRAYPVLNAAVDGTDIVYHEYFDIGVAVSTDRGLLVPVIRDAHNLSLAGIEKAIADFGQRARTGEISMEDLTGGTFTITNGGIFGSMMSTPILNPPQSGILGMHSITERAVVVDGEITARPMMYVALTYDHRIVDGREAVQFLVHIKRQLEDPARLVLQI